jgi:Ca-activated chloride channel homolog
LPRAVLDPASVLATVHMFTAETRPMNVLIALDVSESMDNVVGATGGKTRLQLAQAAAESAISQFDPASSVGLWEFSTDLDGTKPWKSLVPLGTLTATMTNGQTRADNLDAAIGSLRTSGNNKGLYDTIDAAQKTVQTAFNSQVPNFVVVITDGRDDPASASGTPQIDLNSLDVDLTHAYSGHSNVPIMTVALGSQADTTNLADISRTSGGSSFISSTGFDISTVLESALFGQIGQS